MNSSLENSSKNPENQLKFSFRKEEYGRVFYIENGTFTVIPYRLGKYSEEGLNFDISEENLTDAIKITIKIWAGKPIKPKRLGFRLGIDTYMEKYPEWNEKYFPTALRCEKNGFWTCFVSPLSKIISVCSPSKIVSWKNEYNLLSNGDVGHRIYTSSIDFINTCNLPKRHPKSLSIIDEKPMVYTLYYGKPENIDETYSFIEKYANIHIPMVNKFTLEKGESLFVDGKPYLQTLGDGVNTICKGKNAELKVYCRKDWFYYLDCARKSAEKCQQKTGTHAES